MKTAFFIFWVLLTIIAVFELHPDIKSAQSYVSLENYQNPDISCDQLLMDRPWYGKFNPWFFAWIVIVPILIFSASPQTRSWKRGGVLITAIALCYIGLNFATHYQWDIRNAPFKQDPFYPDPVNGWRMDCVDFGDGFTYIISLMFAWIPGCVYAGFWIMVWRIYHHYFSKEAMKLYQSDLMTSIFLKGLKIYIALVIVFVLVLGLNIAYYSVTDAILYPAWILSLPFSLMIRPLFIPFDPFII